MRVVFPWAIAVVENPPLPGMSAVNDTTGAKTTRITIVAAPNRTVRIAMVLRFILQPGVSPLRYLRLP